MDGELPYAWLRQAESDLDAVRPVYDPADGRTACQTVAKCQQVVEKAVKAMVAALNEKGPIAASTGFSHDVGRLVSTVVHLPRRPENKTVQANVAALLHAGHQREIDTLSSFAPRRPSPGQLATRNTEYTYQNPDGSWRAPADPNGFDAVDVKRFRQLATRILTGATQVVSSVYR